MEIGSLELGVQVRLRAGNEVPSSLGRPGSIVVTWHTQMHSLFKMQGLRKCSRGVSKSSLWRDISGVSISYSLKNFINSIILEKLSFSLVDIQYWFQVYSILNGYFFFHWICLFVSILFIWLLDPRSLFQHNWVRFPQCRSWTQVPFIGNSGAATGPEESPVFIFLMHVWLISNTVLV